MIGDAEHGDAGARGRARRARAGVQRPSDAVVWVWRSITRAAEPARGRLRRRAARRGRAPGARASGAVLADQQIEVLALLVGELEEDLLAFGVLEPLAVSLEELVRAALALDADEQRLLIVDAVAQLLGALGEQAVGRALEEQERRPRLELRIAARAARGSAPRACRGARFSSAASFWKTVAAARVAVMRGGAGVELEAAALGGDRDAQRVAREHAARSSRRRSAPRGGRCGTSSHVP